jgi:tRNA G18 (ribose-2'-O)-methylase SpoU
MKPKRLKVQSENQWFQRAEVLKRNRQKRSQHKQFFVEGVHSINQLIGNKTWRIEALLYTPDRPLSNWARSVLEKTSARHHLELTAPLLAKLSDKEEPSELIAIVEMPADDPARIPVRRDAFIVLADRPQSPGNLGTLIRSCEAFGVHGLVVTGHAADLYDPRTIRAAAGAFFSLPMTHIFSLADLTAWLQAIRQQTPDLQLVGTSADGETILFDCPFSQPTLLVIGNEATGLSRRFHELCDWVASIPMAGQTPSLNMASAASVCLYEIQRQRMK